MIQRVACMETRINGEKGESTVHSDRTEPVGHSMESEDEEKPGQRGIIIDEHIESDSESLVARIDS